MSVVGRGKVWGEIEREWESDNKRRESFWVLVVAMFSLVFLLFSVLIF